MIYLIIGIFIWNVAHFFKFVFPNTRARLGEPFKAVVSLALVAAIALMVIGWKGIEPVYYYFPSPSIRALLMTASFVGLALFYASLFPTRLKRFIRHPQLVGFIIWALAHCGLNGDSRSLILFASLALWALLQLMFINRRDGAWVKPDIAISAKVEITMFVLVGVVLALLFNFHQYLSGVAL